MVSDAIWWVKTDVENLTMQIIAAERKELRTRSRRIRVRLGPTKKSLNGGDRIRGRLRFENRVRKKRANFRVRRCTVDTIRTCI